MYSKVNEPKVSYTQIICIIIREANTLHFTKRNYSKYHQLDQVHLAMPSWHVEPNLGTFNPYFWMKRLSEKDMVIGLKDGVPKKVAVHLDFVQMGGGGGRALPKFFVHFPQTVYIGSIWGWGGRGRLLPNFFGTLAFKKSGPN